MKRYKPDLQTTTDGDGRKSLVVGMSLMASGGDWVAYADVEPLERQVAELRDENDQARKFNENLSDEIERLRKAMQPYVDAGATPVNVVIENLRAENEKQRQELLTLRVAPSDAILTEIDKAPAKDAEPTTRRYRLRADHSVKKSAFPSLSDPFRMIIHGTGEMVHRFIFDLLFELDDEKETTTGARAFEAFVGDIIRREEARSQGRA